MGTCVYLWEPMEKTAHGYVFFVFFFFFFFFLGGGAVFKLT